MIGQIADKEKYLVDFMQEMLKTWPGNRLVNLVCHGHSVPAGYFTTPLIDSLNAYPHLLFVGLKERFAHAALNVIVTWHLFQIKYSERNAEQQIWKSILIYNKCF